jgi:cytochrome c oxidase cbb3-type subunit 1
MIGQLTKNERQTALIILLALAVCGLAMAVAGRDDPLGAHGALVILAAVVGIFFVLAGYYLPEPTKERHYHYYDDQPKPASSSRWAGPCWACLSAIG